MLMQPHSLMELSGNAFHLLPFAQGGCLQRAGGAFFLLLLFCCWFVVGDFGLLYFRPPPPEIPLLFYIFCPHERQHWNKLNQNTKTPQLRKINRRGSGSILSSPVPSPCKKPLCREQIGWGRSQRSNPVWAGAGEAGGRGGVPRSAWLLGARFPKSLPASENFQLSTEMH